MGTTNAFHFEAWAPHISGSGKLSFSGTGLDLSSEICPWSPSALLIAFVLLGAYSKPSGSLDASPANKPDWRGDAVVFLLAGKSQSCTAFASFIFQGLLQLQTTLPWPPVLLSQYQVV